MVSQVTADSKIKVRFRKAWEDKIASVKIYKIKRKDSGKLFKEAEALGKMELSRRVRWL